jgi:hypothetical protein
MYYFNKNLSQFDRGGIWQDDKEGHKPRYEAHIYNLLPGFFKGVQPKFQTGTSSFFSVDVIWP